MIIDAQFSSNEHIVRTTQQWESASVKYKIIPNGCLCVEFTVNGKTRIKVGDGHKYYEQLPYIGGDIDIQEIIFIIEEYIDSKEFLEIKEPVVQSVDDLPSTGNDIGDFRFVVNENPTGEHDIYIPYIWFDNRWNIVGGASSDMSNYPTKQEMYAAIDVVDNRVDTLSETVASQSSKILELDNDVDNLSDTVGTFDSRITNVENVAHTHSNKSILDNTTASFTTQEKTKLAGIEDHANNYSLPAATDDSLGGIIVGDGLSIDANGVLSADGGTPYELPPATTTTLGGVIVGDNLSITEQGILSANAQQIDVDDHLDDESTNPVQNRVLTPVLEALSREITPNDVDLWWGMNDAPARIIGKSTLVLYGTIANTADIGVAEQEVE